MEKTVDVSCQELFDCITYGESFENKLYLRQNRVKHPSKISWIRSIRKKYLLYFRYRLRWKKYHVYNFYRKSFLCLICQKSFIKESIMGCHMKMCHSNDELKCLFCEYWGDSYCDLMAHSQKHADEQPYQCANCGDRFVSLPELTKHEQYHDVKSFHCDVCGNSFRKNKYLRRHMNTHTLEHECRRCNKKFAHRTSLKSHQNTNEGEVNTCRKCGLTFEFKCQLMNHWVDHRNLRLDSDKQLLEYMTIEKGATPYTCKLCCTRYSSKRWLVKHLMVFHLILYYDSKLWSRGLMIDPNVILVALDKASFKVSLDSTPISNSSQESSLLRAPRYGSYLNVEPPDEMSKSNDIDIINYSAERNTIFNTTESCVQEPIKQEDVPVIISEKSHIVHENVNKTQLCDDFSKENQLPCNLQDDICSSVNASEEKVLHNSPEIDKLLSPPGEASCSSDVVLNENNSSGVFHSASCVQNLPLEARIIEMKQVSDHLQINSVKKNDLSENSPENGGVAKSLENKQVNDHLKTNTVEKNCLSDHSLENARTVEKNQVTGQLQTNLDEKKEITDNSLENRRVVSCKLTESSPISVTSLLKESDYFGSVKEEPLLIEKIHLVNQKTIKDRKLPRKKVRRLSARNFRSKCFNCKKYFLGKRSYHNMVCRNRKDEGALIKKIESTSDETVEPRSIDVVERDIQLEVKDIVCNICNISCESEVTFREHEKLHSGNMKDSLVLMETQKASCMLTRGRKMSVLEKSGKKMLTVTGDRRETHAMAYSRNMRDVNVNNKVWETKLGGAATNDEEETKAGKKMVEYDATHDKKMESKIVLKCTVCYKVFYKKEALKIHIHMHKKAGWTFCPYCCKGFKHKASLLSHCMIKHKKDCSARFSKKNIDLTSDNYKNLKKVTKAVDMQTKLKGKYCCLICNRKFVTKESLRKHMFLHENCGKFECSDCDKVYRWGFSLIRHYREVHHKNIYHKNACHKNVKSSKEVININCFVCSKVFHSMEAFKAHILLHEKAGLFICSECGAYYKYRSNRNTHIRKNHMKVVKSGPKILEKKNIVNTKAKYPGIEENTKANLITNLKQEQIRKCPACRRKFVCREIFATHILIHEKAGWYICPECCLCFWYKEGLADHCKTNHSKYKLLKKESKIVDKDDDVKILKDGLADNIKTNQSVSKLLKTKTKTVDKNNTIKELLGDNKAARSDNNKERMLYMKLKRKNDYYCSLCKRKYLLKQTFEAHIFLHERSGWIFCYDCGNCYKSTSDLLSHQRECHMVKETKEAMDKERDEDKLLGVELQQKEFLNCSVCGKSFVFRRAFRDHIKVHEKTGWFICGECGNSYRNSSNLIGHQREHHTEEKEVLSSSDLVSYWKTHFRITSELKVQMECLSLCDKCGKYYGTTKSDLHRHLLIHKEESDRCSADEVDLASHEEKSWKMNENLMFNRMKCLDCGKRFATKKYLDIHFKICHTVKDFRANKYSSNESVQKGSTTALNVRPGSLTEWKRPSEVGNAQQTSSKSSLMASKHRTNRTRKKFNKCPDCGALFIHEATLSYHTRRFHFQEAVSNKDHLTVGETEGKKVLSVSPEKMCVKNDSPAKETNLNLSCMQGGHSSQREMSGCDFQNPESLDENQKQFKEGHSHRVDGQITLDEDCKPVVYFERHVSEKVYNKKFSKRKLGNLDCITLDSLESTDMSHELENIEAKETNILDSKCDERLSSEMPFDDVMPKVEGFLKTSIISKNTSFTSCVTEDSWNRAGPSKEIKLDNCSEEISGIHCFKNIGPKEKVKMNTFIEGFKESHAFGNGNVTEEMPGSLLTGNVKKHSRHDEMATVGSPVKRVNNLIAKCPMEVSDLNQDTESYFPSKVMKAPSPTEERIHSHSAGRPLVAYEESVKLDPQHRPTVSSERQPELECSKDIARSPTYKKNLLVVQRPDQQSFHSESSPKKYIVVKKQNYLDIVKQISSPDMCTEKQDRITPVTETPHESLTTLSKDVTEMPNSSKGYVQLKLSPCGTVMVSPPPMFTDITSPVSDVNQDTESYFPSKVMKVASLPTEKRMHPHSAVRPLVAYEESVRIDPKYRPAVSSERQLELECLKDTARSPTSRKNLLVVQRTNQQSFHSEPSSKKYIVVEKQNYLDIVKQISSPDMCTEKQARITEAPHKSLTSVSEDVTGMLNFSKEYAPLKLSPCGTVMVSPPPMITEVTSPVSVKVCKVKAFSDRAPSSVGCSSEVGMVSSMPKKSPVKVYPSPQHVIKSITGTASNPLVMKSATYADTSCVSSFVRDPATFSSELCELQPKRIMSCTGSKYHDCERHGCLHGSK